MPAVLYLVIVTIFGWIIKESLEINVPKPSTEDLNGKKSLLHLTFEIPFAIIAGATVFTTFHYFVTVFFSVFIDSGINPLFFSNITTLPAMSLIIAVYFIRGKKEKKKTVSATGLFKDFYFRSLVVFVLISGYIVFYSFFVKDNILHSGFSVFSDFAPHTAVISSFSRGHNFPAEYPHFAGDGINHHFFFFYLCANLHYLGMRIDFAMNIPSILGMVSFSCLLGHMAVHLTGKDKAFLIAPLMLYFRSSYAVFDYLTDLYRELGMDITAIVSRIFETDFFIGNTRHDDWGLWALNVYANQRHLLWGFSLVLIVITLFIPTIDTGFENIGLKQYFTERDLWRIKDRKKIFVCSMLVAVLPYWHGSMLITLLCVLMVMAFFAGERLGYICTGLIGVGAAFFWTGIFSGGASSVANPSFYWGFISDDKSLGGVLLYSLNVTGISFIIALLLFIAEKRKKQKVLMFAFMAPFIFAFTVSITPDVTVNHKYVIASVALFNIFIAGFLVRIFEITGKIILDFKNSQFFASRFKNLLKVSGMVFLSAFVSFSLFATGFIELVGYTNRNRNHVTIDLNSPLISWIEENTDPDDVFLTAPYHMNTFFFSGRKIFFGWTYYTWSAGHDVSGREILMRKLLAGAGGDMEKFMETANRYNIRYLIIDNELKGSREYETNIAFFEENFEKVFSMPDTSDLSVFKLAE